MSLNKIVIMGRFTADPDFRTTPSGVSVVSFGLAVDRDIKSKETGQRETDFIDCVAWRSTAEFVTKYFQKGSLAVVEGRLQIRGWTDKEGNKRRSAEVVADNVYFGGTKANGSGSGTPSGYAVQQYSDQTPYNPQYGSATMVIPWEDENPNNEQLPF